jgi:chromosome partitioning protein
MAFVIAISNQKGGVGKTTSAVNIASELAALGRKTLVVDFDPQGSASSGLGLRPAEGDKDLYDMFFGTITLQELIRPTAVPSLSLAPASADLVGLEIELGKTPGRELILSSQLKLLRDTYEYIIIDCPPSSGLLTLNALGAATHVLIPLQAEYYALEGLTALLNTIAFVQGTFNPKLAIAGVFLTMFDGRTNLSTQVEAEVREHFKDLAFATRVPRNIKISESQSHGQPIGIYDPTSTGAKAYAAIAKELDVRLFGVEQGAVANS